MKKFLINTSIFMAASVATMYLVFVIPLFRKNYYTLMGHERNVQLSKLHLAAKRGTSKIIFIGGSGCGFGIDSRKVSESFGMPVFNTGTHASIGLRLQIELFKEDITEGDIIVVIPEYQQYSDLVYLGDDTALRVLASTYPRGFKKCSPFQLLRLLTFSPKYYRDARLTFPYSPDTNDPYSVLSLNEYGDVTSYESRRHRTIGVASGLIDKYNPEVIRYLNKCNREISAKGATMLLFPPAIHQPSYDLFESQVTDLVNSIKKTSDIQFASSTERYALPDTLFFDTPYHLTYDGVEYRTSLLIEDISKYLSASVK